MHTVWIIGLFFTVEIEINNNTETLKPFKENPVKFWEDIFATNIKHIF